MPRMRRQISACCIEGKYGIEVKRGLSGQRFGSEINIFCG